MKFDDQQILAFLSPRNRSHVAERFRDFLRDAGWTHKEAAEKLSLPHRETVTEIAAGRRLLRVETLIALLTLTKRSFDDFWD